MQSIKIRNTEMMEGRAFMQMPNGVMEVVLKFKSTFSGHE